MAARIFLFFIAFIFLLTGFIYSVVLIHDHFTQDETETRTSQEINQERLDNLENLGSLADFEPPTEPLTEVRAETVAEGQGDLSVIETDVITLKLTYALASNGQIFRDYLSQSQDGVKYLDYTAGFRALLPSWQEHLLDTKIGSKHRVFIPAQQREIFFPFDIQDLPADQDFVLELDLVGIADRSLTGFADRETLADFQPLAEPLEELRVEDLVEGAGQAVEADDVLVVNYIGVLAADGSKFDANDAIEFPLSGVIPGWQTGLLEMKTGGKRRVFIPAAQAYGEAGFGEAIPPNSDLVFDVELLAITEQEE